jgi:putative FmdB family regulatory protein
MFMPIYEYRCNECGDLFEKMVKFSDADILPACPKCESKDTRKMLSTVASFGNSSSGTSSSSNSGCGSSGGFT